MRPLPAVLGFLVLALGLCWPALRDPTRYALGHPANDVWNHVWGYWWVADSLLGGRLPLHTELLNWPEGGTLWFIDMLGALATLPITATLGPVAAYNASMVGNLWLCGIGAWLLAYDVTGSRPASLLAGVAYVATPHLLGQVYNGISETVAAGWLPLTLLAGRRVLAEPTPGRGAALGALFGLTTVASWYYGVFAAFGVAAMVARAAWLHGWRASWRALRRRPSAILAPALVAGLVAAVVVAPPLALFRASMEAEDAVVTRDPRFVWMTLIMHNMTDLVSMFRPGKHYSPDLAAAYGEELIVVVYLGYALLVPAVVALFRDRRAEPWFLGFLGFSILCLGPFLYVGGAYVGVAGGWLPLPFLALYDYLPMFSRISHAYRFAAPAGLMLAVLAAILVAGSRRPVLLATVLGGARLGESLLLSPAVWPFPVADVSAPAIYAELDGGAVIDLPITRPVLERSRVLAWQIVHRQPVPFGLNDPVPAFLRGNRYAATLVEVERRNVSLLPPELPLLDWAVGQADLVAHGARWIVVHREGYSEAQFGRVSRFLDLTATPYADDGNVRVYRLDAPATARRP